MRSDPSSGLGRSVTMLVSRLLLAVLASVDASSTPMGKKCRVDAVIEFKGVEIGGQLGFRGHSMIMLHDDMFGPSGHKVSLLNVGTEIYDADVERANRTLYSE